MPGISETFVIGDVIENEDGGTIVFKGYDRASAKLRQGLIVINPSEFDSGDWTVGDPITITVEPSA